uniref:Uncharacterized protein n=1 Tax=Trichuris muris TaxID=70415 RepID=A0A5S6QX30_TRIMR
MDSSVSLHARQIACKGAYMPNERTNEPQLMLRTASFCLSILLLLHWVNACARAAPWVRVTLERHLPQAGEKTKENLRRLYFEQSPGLMRFG